MAKNIVKIISLVMLCFVSEAQAQRSIFRTKDRADNLEGFDEQKFSWGFFLAANSYDYKLVLDPNYGMNGNQNAVLVKSSPSFGAGLIGKMRLNENLDLRLEPGLQFMQRELTFNTQFNDKYSLGTKTIEPFTPIELSGDLKVRNVKSTYIDVPLLLEFHGDRWYNSRPYAAAGVNYLVNLQSNESSSDDNQQAIFRTTTHNFGWSVEAGIQLYFNKFKLTPGFRGTFVTNNELVQDNKETPPYWAKAISTAQTRAFMFVLKFE